MNVSIIVLFLGLLVSTTLMAQSPQAQWKCSKIYQPGLTNDQILADLRTKIETHLDEKVMCRQDPRSSSSFVLDCDGKELDAVIDYPCPTIYYGNSFETWIGMILITQGFNLNAATASINGYGSNARYFTRPVKKAE